MFFSFLEIVQLDLYVGSFKYPANIYLLRIHMDTLTLDNYI